MLSILKHLPAHSNPENPAQQIIDSAVAVWLTYGMSQKRKSSYHDTSPLNCKSKEGRDTLFTYNLSAYHLLSSGSLFYFRKFVLLINWFQRVSEVQNLSCLAYYPSATFSNLACAAKEALANKFDTLCNP